LGNKGGKIIAVCAKAMEPNDGGSRLVGGLNFDAGQQFHGILYKKSKGYFKSSMLMAT
jgi:hypothetical protein